MQIIKINKICEFLKKNKRTFKMSGTLSETARYKTIDEIPENVEKEKMNMFMAINNALDIILEKD
jgi:hypothetical protein